MKHSIIIAAVAALSLSACSGSNDIDNTERNLSSPSECKQAGVDEVSCVAAYNAALKNHQASAPRYNSYQSCVAEYGPNMCSNDDGSGSFMPLMAGFMIGNMMNGQYSSRPLYGYSGHYYDSPTRYRSAYHSDPQVRKTVTSYRPSPSAPKYVQKPVTVPVRTAPIAKPSYSKPSSSSYSSSSSKPSYSRSSSSSSSRSGFGSSGSSRGSSS